MIQDARGWCTGKTPRDEMGREVEEGFRMGNTCTPVEDSCQCMAKPIQYKAREGPMRSRQIPPFSHCLTWLKEGRKERKEGRKKGSHVGPASNVAKKATGPPHA